MPALDGFDFLFSQDGGYLRIPIWGHIPLSLAARKIIEHPDFVRLQKIRQLGWVYYVFPGATHTRFEHSIGAYHLSVLMLQRLVMNPVNWESGVPKITPEEARVFLAASLLHDIGHYPFAHLVDRLPGFETHEDRVRSYILEGGLSSILADDWGVGPEGVANAVINPQDAGLPGRMLSGILDPDKMDYLMRDAWACAVPYGNIDTDRLIESIVLDTEHRRLGITEKGVAPLESLVFAKYMMFRHIYWHHAVRIAVAMFTRFVQDGLEEETIEPSSFYSLPDDALVEELASKADRIPSGELMMSLKNRSLYKRAFTLYPEQGAGEEEFTIAGPDLEKVRELYWRPDIRKKKEMEICRLISCEEGINLAGHEVLLDIPRVVTVFDVDDFRELRVLVSSQSGGEDRFVPFDSYGFTQLTADFVQEFERFSRRVQVISRPDLREALVRNRKEVKSVVVM
jgi:HD superfamily phosphohydrolase